MKQLILAAGLLFGAGCSAPSDLTQEEAPTGIVQQRSVVDPSFFTLVSSITSKMSDYSKYFSGAKTAYDVGKQLGALLGLWSSDDPSAQYNSLAMLVTQDARAIDWKITQDFIDTNRSLVESAFIQYQEMNVVSALDDLTSIEGLHTLATSDVPYYRLQDDSLTNGDWKTAIADRPQVINMGQDGNETYDWRIGLTALMETTTLRLALIAAQDSNFRWDHLYDSELRFVRDKLLWNYNQMIAGLKCGTSGLHYCADIYTGLSVSARLDGTTWEVARIRLLSQLKQQMPIFALRSMIDTLNLYIDGVTDLTESYQSITVSQAPNLCLDAPGSDTSVLLKLNQCDGSTGQWWTYDRQNNTIVNGYGWYLDVQRADVVVQSGGSPNPVSWPPAWTWGYNGTNAQRWTYDPDTHVLQNALGTALDFQWGNLNVQTRAVDGSLAQQWRADQPSTIQPNAQSTCGMLKPGEGLLGAQAASSCNGIYHLKLAPAGTLVLNQTSGVSHASNPWIASSYAEPGSVLIMQDDGNLVLYNARGGAVWHTNTWGHPGAYLSIQDGGDLAIIDANGARLWSINNATRYREHRAPPSILWYNAASGELSTWALDENGNVVGQRSLSLSCNSPLGCLNGFSVAATGDVNGDGSTDILSQSGGGATAWLVDRTGNIDNTRVQGFSLSGFTPIALLDLDGDGRTDLIWHNTQTGEVRGALLDNAGQVTGSTTLSWTCDFNSACSYNWFPVAAMDVNSDGRKDLLWQNPRTGELSAWLLNGNVIGATSLSWNCGSWQGCALTWKVVGAGDFNSDGTPDLLWYNSYSGELSAWLTDGYGNVTGTLSINVGCETTSFTLMPPSGCGGAWKPVGLINLR